MSCAPTSRRGLPLNCRLLVKGIQKASRLLGEASKFATSTVELMMRSVIGVDAGTLSAMAAADKPRGGLAHHSPANWPAAGNGRRSPCPAENEVRSAVPASRWAARGLRRLGETERRTPCPAVEDCPIADERRWTPIGLVEGVCDRPFLPPLGRPAPTA